VIGICFIHRNVVQKPYVADNVETTFNITFQNPLCRSFLAQAAKDVLTRILRASALHEAK